MGIKDSQLPLKPPPEHQPKKPVTPAPAWVALATAWLGLVTLLTSLALPFIPGSRRPRQELERAAPYSAADKFILVPVYASILGIFLGCVVFWQMRREPRPLPPAMLAQRVQAWVGIILASAGVVFFYVYVGMSMAWRSR